MTPLELGGAGERGAMGYGAEGKEDWGGRPNADEEVGVSSKREENGKAGSLRAASRAAPY